MSSPQEVLELAIPHPLDATPDTRRTAAKTVIQALQVNDYYFVRRRIPVQDYDDGQCSTCKSEHVHIMHGPSFLNSEDRIQWQQRRIEKLESGIRSVLEKTTNTEEVVMMLTRILY